MTIAVDIDGVLVENLPSDKIFEAKGIQETIQTINELYAQGHQILIYTARGMRRLNGQQHLIPHEYYEKTKHQLDSIGVKYHSLIFGKLAYDILLDDKATDSLERLKQLCLKT